jgi:hypothetical protein
MTDIMCSVLVAVHPSKAKPNLFGDANYFRIASKVHYDSLWQILLMVGTDCSSWSLCNTLNNHHTSSHALAFLGTCAETDSNSR